MEPVPFEAIKSKLSLAPLGKPALVGLAAIAIMVAVFAGRILMGTATATEFNLSHESAQSNTAVGSEGPENQSENAQKTIFVHVSGCVANPGLYEVESGSRVAVAIEAAGGFSDDAVCDSVNLARVLQDGELIVVASSSSMETSPDASANHAENSSSVTGGGAGNVSPTGKINLNSASAAELEQLPGIGQATAAKIIADRNANGPFKTVDDLKRVSGIGDKKFEALVGLICV